MEIWFAVAIAAAIAGYFIFFRRLAQTDPRVRALAARAYFCAAKIDGAPPKGDIPPVILRTAPWFSGGRTVYGLYTWRGLFGKVLWDKIQVVADRSYIFPVLVHEMTHAIRRRRGDPTDEKIAYAAQAKANELCGGPEVDALLEKL